MNNLLSHWRYQENFFFHSYLINNFLTVNVNVYIIKFVIIIYYFTNIAIYKWKKNNNTKFLNIFLVYFFIIFYEVQPILDLSVDIYPYFHIFQEPSTQIFQLSILKYQFWNLTSIIILHVALPNLVSYVVNYPSAPAYDVPLLNVFK